MSSKQFMNIIQQVEEISENMSKVGGYASLSYSSDTQSDEATSLMTRMSKLGSEISNKILFFEPMAGRFRLQAVIEVLQVWSA